MRIVTQARRAFVGQLATGAAGTALAISAARGASALSTARESDSTASPEIDVHMSASSNAPTVDPPTIDQPIAAGDVSPAPAPWHLLHPLRAGSSLVGGWSVADLSGVVGGACVMTLANQRGREH